MFIVYQITNLVNGKIYVGKTTKSLGERWASHLAAVSRGKRSRLYAAIRKYGPSCFFMEMIDSTPDLEALDDLERKWISEKNSNNPLYGYNMTEGGEGGDTFGGRKHRPESIAKMVEKSTGRIPTEETKEKIRRTHRLMVGEKSCRRIKTISSEDIVRLYVDENKTTRQIARIFGVEKTMVLGRLRSSGVQLRLNPREERTARLVAEGKEHLVRLGNGELIKLYLDGNSLEKITMKFECTSGAIRTRLLKEGVALRSRTGKIRETNATNS
jgi:group I intron endonuclease